MRVNWGVKCLEGQGKRLVTRAAESGVDPVSTGVEFGVWVETLLAVTEVILHFLYYTWTLTVLCSPKG